MTQAQAAATETSMGRRHGRRRRGGRAQRAEEWPGWHGLAARLLKAFLEAAADAAYAAAAGNPRRRP